MLFRSEIAYSLEETQAKIPVPATPNVARTESSNDAVQKPMQPAMPSLRQAQPASPPPAPLKIPVQNTPQSPTQQPSSVATQTPKSPPPPPPQNSAPKTQPNMSMPSVYDVKTASNQSFDHPANEPKAGEVISESRNPQPPGIISQGPNSPLANL